MTILYLARHGNTFAPDQTPVMVGCRTDLPLVESGHEQAAALGRLMKGLKPPRRLQSGTLLRARQSAEGIAAAAGWDVPVETDSALMELDYGSWEGLSDADLAARGETGRITAWRKQGLWPAGAGWSPQPDEIIAGWRRLAETLGDGPTLAVSSNGVLRFALHLIPGAWEQAVAEGRLTMRTGALSALDLGPSPRLLFWDRRPADGLPTA